jgi:hypothetical protein
MPLGPPHIRLELFPTAKLVSATDYAD